MHLKIEFDNTEKIYSFPNSSLIKIGRSPDCDIQLLVDGVSRFHLEVFIENGDFYVRDLATTNGSFLNEDKLPANEKISFNTFFPVKLGFNVWVSLLDESEVIRYQNENSKIEAPKSNHATGKNRIVKSSVNEKSAARTSPGMKSKKESKGESSFLRKSFLPLLCMAGFFVYAVMQKEEEETTPPIVQKIEETKKPEVKEVHPVKVASKTTDTLLKSSLTSDKCLTAVEKSWCDAFQARHSKTYYDGAYFFLGTMFIVQDYKKFSEEQKNDLSLNERQKREASILAKREKGREFDSKKFMNEQSYRIRETDPLDAKRAYVLLDFIQSNYAPLVEAEKSIEKIVYVLKENENEYFSYEIPASHIETILNNKEELIASINFLLVTGFESNFQRLTERLKL